jgi:hypothetical protein
MIAFSTFSVFSNAANASACSSGVSPTSTGVRRYPGRETAMNRYDRSPKNPDAMTARPWSYPPSAPCEISTAGPSPNTADSMVLVRFRPPAHRP